MKIKITGPSQFVILAETEHERQWLEVITCGFQAKGLPVAYTYPNHEPKDFNNPVLTIGEYE